MMVSQPRVCSEDLTLIHSFNPKYNPTLHTGKVRPRRVMAVSGSGRAGVCSQPVWPQSPNAEPPGELPHTRQRARVLGSPSAGPGQQEDSAPRHAWTWSPQNPCAGCHRPGEDTRRLSCRGRAKELKQPGFAGVSGPLGDTTSPYPGNQVVPLWPPLPRPLLLSLPLPPAPATCTSSLNVQTLPSWGFCTCWSLCPNAPPLNLYGPGFVSALSCSQKATP